MLIYPCQMGLFIATILYVLFICAIVGCIAYGIYELVKWILKRSRKERVRK